MENQKQQSIQNKFLFRNIVWWTLSQIFYKNFCFVFWNDDQVFLKHKTDTAAHSLLVLVFKISSVVFQDFFRPKYSSVRAAKGAFNKLDFRKLPQPSQSLILAIYLIFLAVIIYLKVIFWCKIKFNLRKNLNLYFINTLVILWIFNSCEFFFIFSGERHTWNFKVRLPHNFSFSVKSFCCKRLIQRAHS